MAKKTEAKEIDDGQKRDKRGTPYYDVMGPKGEHICRVANYQDPVVDQPEGMGRLLDYLPVFNKEVANGKWGGFGFDSVSFAALSARKYHQYELNPDTNNPLQWYGGSSDMIEELVCLQLPAMACHVGCVFHVHRRKVEAEGSMVRQPFVPGKRLEETKMTAAAWPELWRLFVQPDGDKRKRFLQTECSEKYQAGSCIGLPDDLRIPRTLPEGFVWQGWKGKGKRPEVHFAIYGDPHVGKSSFVAQALLQLCEGKPFYIALFDARGKDVPYRLLGEVAE